MELLQEGVVYLDKRLKGIVYDLTIVKVIRILTYLMTIFAAIAICVIIGLVVTNTLTFTLAEVIALIVMLGIYIWWIWYISPSITNYCGEEIIELEIQKKKCERDIEKYKNDMNDLREMEKREMKKKAMKSKTKLTEKQTETLNNYTEKAKQFFKWLIVTKDGEVVASDLKPEYDEEFDNWFFNSEAKPVQVGSNKKLAKHSKHTLTRIV